KENGRNSRVPAKFEQGGFTSGRRKGPQTLFPGTSPGNLPQSIDRVPTQWSFQRVPTRRNFFWLVCKNRNSPEPCTRFRPSNQDWSNQLSRVSATLRNRKSRNTLIRFEVRSSSG